MEEVCYKEVNKQQRIMGFELAMEEMNKARLLILEGIRKGPAESLHVPSYGG